MRGKRIEDKLSRIQTELYKLAGEIEQRNNVIFQQNEIIKHQRIHLDKTMDRLMSRNFQELSTYTPLNQPATDFALPDMEDMLIGTVGELPSEKPGNLNEY